MNLKYRVLLSLFLLTPAACKSKLEKCNDACANIEAERITECAGDESCIKTTKATTASCLRLCDSAMGDGRKSDGASDSSASEPAKPKRVKLADGCKAGTASDCVDLAAMHIKGLGGATKSDAKAYHYVSLGCQHGDMFGCEMQAKMLRDGRGTKVDVNKANVLFEKACKGKSYGACTSLGLAAMKQDRKRGVSLLTKACDGDDKLGCMALGGIYLHGNGVRADRAKAKTLLGKACRLGAQKACAKAATL